MWVSMTLSDLSYLRKGTFYRRSYSLTWNDQILHRNTCGGGTCFEVSRAPIPRRWDPTSPKLFGTSYLNPYTTTKFCTMIKLDKRRNYTGSTMHRHRHGFDVFEIFLNAPNLVLNFVLQGTVGDTSQ